MVKKLSHFSFILSLVLILINQRVIAQTNTASNGNWSSIGIWSLGAIPATDTNVVIPAGVTVFVDMNTDFINDLTVNGTLIVNNAASVSLNIKGNITVGSNGVLTNNGRIDLINSTTFTLNNNATYTHNPRANVISDESIFEFGNEVFVPSSNLIINKWSSTSNPLFDVTRIGANDIGNLTVNFAGFSPWEQDGLFLNKVKGKLTVTAGTLRMDNGLGNSTTLTLQDVDVIGSGNIIFQEGANRPLTLTTGNFLFNSSTTDTMFIMNGKLGSAIGNLTWNVNGNLDIRNSFIGIYNVDSLQRNANATINVTGNFNLSRAIRFDILKQVNGSCNITVGGDFTIGGPVFPLHVRFIDSFSGALNFSANNVYIQGGNGNTFMGGSAAPWVFTYPKGLVNFNVNQDFIISGTSITHIVNSPAYYHAPTVTFFPAKVNKTRVTVGRDFITSNNLADFKVANDSSAVTFLVGRDLTMTGGYFDAQVNPNSIFTDSIVVAGNFTFNSSFASNFFKANNGTGTTVFRTLGNFNLLNSGILSGQGIYGNYGGNGNVEFFVGGNFTQNNGLFSGIFSSTPSGGNGNLNYTVTNTFTLNGGYHYGVNNTASTNSGVPTFQYGAIDFNNGYYEAYKASNILYALNTYNVTGDVDITFVSAANTFQINSISLIASNTNTMGLNLTIGGDLLISGTTGNFISSKGSGNELINITGDVSISGGNNSFNFLPGNLTNHNVVMNIGGDFSHGAGATTFLSGDEGDFTGTISGNLTITGGVLNMKGAPPISKHMELIVDGGFNMSSGAFYFYNNLIRPNNVFESIVTINANDDFTGDFSHSGGTINMCNNANSTKWDTLDIKSPFINIGATGLIITSYPNTSLFNGCIKYSRSGTSTFTRAIGSGHYIQQVKQSIEGGTTLDVIAGDFMVCSHSNPNIDHLSILTGAIMILRNNSKIFSNCTATNAGVYVGNAGRLRIQNSNGLYDGTNNSAISSLCNMDYYLFPQSIVEYMSDDTQKLTGIGVGKAIASKHKYGILEINNGGWAGQEWVYVSSVGFVSVRQQLILTKGELNLSTSSVYPRDVNAGGAPILIENPMDTALKSVGINERYIRAETYDGQSQLRWRIGNNTLVHTIPFKRDFNDPATGANWLSVSYTGNAAAGVTDTVSFTTFRSNNLNLPYPPSVSHVDNLSGVPNGLNTIDRFWLVRKTGVSITGNISLKASTTELVTPSPASPFYKGQNFLNATMAWNFPIPGVQSWSTVTNTLTMTNVPVQQTNGWWAIATAASPLPVELLSFNAECLSNNRKSIKWTTASELNNSYFEVEKSLTGNNFSLLKRVTGSGTVNSITHYEIIDDGKENSKLYYRLKQVDYNGEPADLKTISLSTCNTSNNFEIVSLIKNTNTINLIANSNYEGLSNLTLIDNSGRIIEQKTLLLNLGLNTIEINKSISGGIYLVNVTSGSQSYSQKVFIQK